MDDQNKLDGDDAANFGNSHAAESGAEVVYVANFEGDDIDGKTYSLGDKIDAGVDPATIAYLVQIGRVSATSPDSANSPAGGEGNSAQTGGKAAGGEGEDTITLSDAEQADADALVADNSAEDLRGMLPEGASKSGSKSDLAARIVAGRR